MRVSRERARPRLQCYAVALRMPAASSLLASAAEPLSRAGCQTSRVRFSCAPLPPRPPIDCIPHRGLKPAPSTACCPSPPQPAYVHRTATHPGPLPTPRVQAPGYSSIIKEPMDFSTMRGKMERGEYATYEDLQRDFRWGAGALLWEPCLALRSPAAREGSRSIARRNRDSGHAA